MAVLTGLYVLLGGYMATAINDFIQGIIMLVGIVAVIYTVLQNNGGFMEAINSLAQFKSDNAATVGQPGVFASFFWAGSGQPTRSYPSYFIKNLGSPSDGT